MSGVDKYADADFIQDFTIRQEAQAALIKRVMEAPMDTRVALTSCVASVDAHQRAVVDAQDRTIRVVAPAGSGKTQTVVHRLLHRVRGGVKPSRLLVLTFDNAAASSLREKLCDRLNHASPTGALTVLNISRFQITTLNAYGYQFLQQHVREEYKPVIDARRQAKLVRDAKNKLKAFDVERYATLPSQFNDRLYLDVFSLLKNNLFDPRETDPQRFADFLQTNSAGAEFFIDPHDTDCVYKTIQALQWLFAEYDRSLRSEGVIDYDDQKLRSYVELSQRPDLRTIVQHSYSEVIVDEFQDINLLDFALIRTIAERSNLLVVGDDDQAIYGFRGCSPDFIVNLGKHLHRDIVSYELKNNYRCPPNLVRQADKLIRHNRQRIPKNPVPMVPTPSEITIMPSLSTGLEAKAISAYIKRLVRTDETKIYRDVAVLYRTNAQSLPLQVEFILSDTPYQVRDDDNILANDVLQRLLGALRLLVALRDHKTPDIEDQLLGIQAYFRFVGGYQLEKLRRLFAQYQHYLDAIESPEFFTILPKAKSSAFPSAFREALTTTRLAETIDVLAKRFKGLTGMVGSLEDAVANRVPLAEIKEVAANFQGNTLDFVETMERALIRARTTNAGKDPDGVALRTYFRAKGLQWHTVILTSCNEGIIPHRKAPIEEERRLFYVAMTRSSSNLIVSYVNNTCDTRVIPSRFIKEAGLLQDLRDSADPIPTQPVPRDMPENDVKWYIRRQRLANPQA